MIPLRTLASSFLLTLALGAFAVEEEERLPLAAVEYDTIYTRNGDQIPGTIVGRQADGAVRIDRVGRPTTLVPKAEIVRIINRQTLPEAVSRRGEQALAAEDWIDLQRVLRFAIEKQPEAKPADPKPDEKPPKAKPVVDVAAIKDAAIVLGQKALAKKPSTDIANLTLTLLWEKQDLDGVLGVAQAGLAADPNWTPGYEYQAKIFLLRKQDDRMRALVKIWLERQPTTPLGNRYLASIAEAAGDMRTAAEAYRKGFDLHQDWESALGYARCSLKRGDRDECIRACNALIAKSQLVGAAKAWRGAAQLAIGTPDADTLAQADLEAALAATGADKLDAESADLARYDLGLLYARAGRTEDARKLWAQVTGPMGAVALAQLERKPISADGLPASLAGFVAAHNAAIDLENKRWQGVLGGGFDTSSNKRAVFLSQVAMLLKSAGGDDSIHNLAATVGDESVRWQAYGLMLQSRFKDAEALLDKLPVTDGWAIACRVYIAAARKDDAAASSWLKRLDGATGVPKQYAQQLIAELASANDEVASEAFDWTDGEVATGWDVAAPGTNITVHAKSGQLELTGSQLGNEPTCAYKLVLADRLRSAEIKLDTTTLGAGIGGLEIADDKRENGLELGVSGARVVWRAAEKGTWGPWADTGLPTVGAQSVIRIELDKGRLYAALAEKPDGRVPLTASLGKSDRLSIGIFGVAEPGTTWTLLADDLVIQLRPVARR